MDYLKLAETYQTPLFVYDFDKISAQFLALKEAFKARKSLLCYALKANSNLSILHHLSLLGSGADCVSIGEVRRALKAQIAPYKIIFSGVGKQENEIMEALESDILLLNVESQAELSLIAKIAKDMRIKARISIRVNPDINAKTHPYISTGLRENKFGVDIEVAKSMYIFASKHPHLLPIGIHFHIGSQLTELEPIIQSARKVASLARGLQALKIDLKFFDVGGGIGIAYENEDIFTPYQYVQGILQELTGLDVTIICEPGRFIVGEGGVLLTKVLYEKRTSHKRFVIVDAAMNDFMRPALYNAKHSIEMISDSQSCELSQCDVVGAICESSDYLAKDIMLPNLQQGDILAIKNAGAYGYSMSSNYNTRSRPAEVGILQGKARLIKSRERFESLISDEYALLKEQITHSKESNGR